MTEETLSPNAPIKKTIDFRTVAYGDTMEVTDLSNELQFAKVKEFERLTPEDARGIAGIGTVVDVEQVTIQSWSDVAKVIKVINESAGDIELDIRYGNKLKRDLRVEIESAFAEFGQTGNLGDLVAGLNGLKEEKGIGETLTLADGKAELEVKVARFDDYVSRRDNDNPPAFDDKAIAAAMRDVNKPSSVEPIEGHFLVIDTQDEVNAALAIAHALSEIKEEQGVGATELVKASTDFKLILRQPKAGGNHLPQGHYRGFEFTAEQILKRVANVDGTVAAALESLKPQVESFENSRRAEAESQRRTEEQQRAAAERLQQLEQELQSEAPETVADREQLRQEIEQRRAALEVREAEFTAQREAELSEQKESLVRERDAIDRETADRARELEQREQERQGELVRLKAEAEANLTASVTVGEGELANTAKLSIDASVSEESGLRKTASRKGESSGIRLRIRKQSSE